MIRFVRISLAIVAAGVAVGFVQRELGLHEAAWGLGNAATIAIGMLLAGLADRERFYGTSPKRRR